MQNIFTVLFRKACIPSLFLLLLSSSAMAQIDINIGTGTTGNGSGNSYPAPIQDYYEGSRAQYLYLASELIAAGMGPGMISAIKFNVVALNDATIVEQYTLKIGTTTISSLTTTGWEPVGSPVWGPVDYQPVAGMNTFTFTTPFFWNGTDNLVVEPCNGGDDWDSSPTVPWTTGLSFNGSRTYRADGSGNLCGTTTTTAYGTPTTRPNITFTWTPAAACTGTPTGGTATANPSSVCMNESFTLGLTGATVASGLSYQWQSSPDNLTWTNIPGATSPGFTTTQAASTWYRCTVTCTNTGGGSAASTAVQVVSPTLVSGTFTIDKNNPTDPIVAKNFNSFNDAYNYIKCGINGPVIFNVVAASGPYNEQLIMTAVPGASAANTVTFNGNGQTLSYTSTNGTQRAVIKLDGADHITFDSLAIEAGGTSSSEYGYGVHLINDADSNTISNCTINVDTASTSTTNYVGIVISSSHTSPTTTGDAKCDGNIISGNTITGGNYGITMVGSNNFANGNNRIVNNLVKEFRSYGIYLAYSFNALVEGNTITRPSRTEVTTFYGIYLTSLNTKDSISRNRITDPFGGDPSSTSTFYGIYFTSVDALTSLENIVSNNLIYNITGGGTAYGIYNSSSDNVYYYHNTIVMDGAAGGSSNTTRGFYNTSQTDGIYFMNNIVYLSRSGGGAKHALYFNNTGSTIVSDYNVLFIAPTVTDASIGYFSADRATLPDWQAASGQDTTSLSSNPMFTDPNTGNYSPVNASIDNKGTPAGIAVDIENSARSTTTPDIGAYEFTPPPCTVPPTPGTTTAALNPVCVNVRVPFSLTGNSVGLTQTYQYEVSATAGGPYTPLGSPLTNPDTIITATVTSYYRVAVTCSGNTAYSTPVLLEVNQALPPDTYTIDKSAAPGTPKTYLSFNEAKAALECGIAGPVVFNVAPGGTPYEEQLILDSIPGASAVNTVTFNGNGNTIHYSSDNTDERAVIKLRRTDHVTFDSLTIDATGTENYGFGIQFIANADSNTIRHCTIITDATSTSTNYAGIVASASDNSATGTGNTLCDDNTIDGNTITGGYYGISLNGDDEALLNNNRVINNTVQDFYYYGIRIAYSDSTLVEGNTITRPSRTNAGSSISGIYIYYDNNNLVISRNRIHNVFGGDPTSTSDFYGIYMYYADAQVGMAAQVLNNAIYNINGTGYIYAVYNNYTSNVHYYHNTISLDHAANTSSDVTRGFYITGDDTGIEVINNIVTVTRGGTGDKYAIYRSSTSGEVTSDYNDYYVNGDNGENFVGYFGGDLATLQAWQAATGQDTNSISLDPVYGDPVNGNLSPVISPLDNTGTPLGVPIDINGTARSATTPDIGAFEISIPPCVAPPNAGTAVANPDANVCLGAIIKLGLTGNTTGGEQTYQWQAAKAAGGPWRDISEVRYVPEFSLELTMENYFRCVVTCGGDTAYSTVAHVNMNAPLMSGFYTIDPASPVSATNFQSFTQAVAALECGIAGWVTFNVYPGTYTEQIRMHRVYGASDTSRITFQSLNNDAASVTLTYDAAGGDNYVLQLDSASYVTYRDITIASIDDGDGRVVELAHTASSDSILNCIVMMPAVTSSGTGVVGIYAEHVTGTDNVIMGNTITNGSRGIHITGTSSSILLPPVVIDSNTISGFYQYGVYAYYTNRIKVHNNTVHMTAPQSSSSYGIYAGYSDTAYQVTNNRVNIENTTNTVYGIDLYFSDATMAQPGRVANNRIKAVTGNTGTLYGLYNYGSSYASLVNNVISIHTTGSDSYGIYTNGDENNTYYNNSVLSTSTSSDDNAAAWFDPDANVRLRNNIFSHQGGGNAMYVYDPDNINSDYNTLYTTGTDLVQRGTPATAFATLQEWKDESNLDLSSIVYKPAFENDSTLTPDVNDPEVWAIHGRGEQAVGNDVDINNQPRPTALADGVPDMGAYEFLPSVTPPALPATPAAPAPGVTQTFMFGTDTVTRVTWGATVPDTVIVRRYSGVIPPNIDQSKEFMYFYTDVDAGAQPYSFSIKQYYVDSWQGTFRKQTDIRLGRTDTADTWQVNDSSMVDDIFNIIADTSLQFLDKFTGLKGNLPTPPPVLQPADSSNRGTRFWVGYGFNQLYYNFQPQEMVLYLSAETPANVTVRINGTSWVKHYQIPANTVITSDTIPRTGLFDARLLAEGLSDKGISIESDEPIVAYAHIFGSASSGATMLLPVGTYGYEYYVLTSKQYYSSSNSYSEFFVIADQDNTVVEITPSVPTLGGRPANVPFTVTLNKGEVYQVLGAMIAGSEGYDLTGSRIRSVQNADGRCFPVAVFSGSSRTGIGCNNNGSSGDNLIVQNFPSQAWGRRYLTAPTSLEDDASSLMTNIFRVLVSDPATVVTRNGVPLTGLINNRYYEYYSNTADYLEADAPVMVAQFMSSSGSCDNTSGYGDPEMFYISPIEQGINKVGLYRNDLEAIATNYLTLIIPTAGMTSLTIDGVNTFDYVYAHPNLPGYTVVVKRWDAEQAQCVVQSDSAFTAITYGLGSVESYGYNAGTLVKNLNALPSFNNVYNESGVENEYTCAKTPFRFSMLISVKPTALTWKFSQVSNLAPATDVTQTDPVPVDSVMVNGRRYYEFTVDSNYVFSEPGTYYVPIVMTHPDIESCENSLETILPITVIPAPVVDFTTSFSGCVGDSVHFHGMATTANGAGIDQWKWNFNDGDTAIIQDPVKKFSTAGVHDVQLSIIEEAGCIGDTTIPVTVNAAPEVVLVDDSLTICAGSDATFEVQNPDPDVTYNWYTDASSGTLAGSGSSLTIPGITATARYFVEAVKAGCVGEARTPAVVTVFPQLTTPVVEVDSVGVNLIRFKWAAVPNATGYEVSTDDGVNWSAPSSGETGLTHTVTGLQPVQEVTLIVKAKGCEDRVSDPVTGKTLPDGVFIPNAFSPNGDGLNDELRVYGYIIRDIHFMIFNQWGEKVFETNTQSRGWDGMYKGKAQPSGVYIYVCRLQLADGTVVEKKGAVNLIR